MGKAEDAVRAVLDQWSAELTAKADPAFAQEQAKLAAAFEAEFLPRLHVVADRLRRRFSTLAIEVTSSLRPDEPGYRDHEWCLTCIFPDRPPERTAMITFAIYLRLYRADTTIMAIVSWDAPSGSIIAELSDAWRSTDEWPAATPEMIQKLRDSFGDLSTALETALSARGP